MKFSFLLLLIYPVALLVMSFYGAKVTRGREAAAEYLSIEQTKMIQAIACIVVVLHHITQQITGYGAYSKGPITILDYIGYLFTALFFFISGYGLYISFLNKPDYLKTFVTRRFPSVLIPFWTINILGVLLCAVGYGIHYTFRDVLCDIFGITLVNSNGWFIIEIVVLYVIFYSLFNLIRNKDIALFLMCVAVVLLIIYSSLQGHDPSGDKSHWFRGEWWYNSTITFAFGMIYARFRKKLDAFLNRHYEVMITVCTIAMAAVIYASRYVIIHYGYYHERMSMVGRRDENITLIVQCICCLLSTVFVLLLNMKITIGNRVLKYIGTLSVELFLIHGYFVNRIFADVKMNDFIRYAVVLACSIGCTALVSPLIRKIVAKALALLNQEKISHGTLESEIAEKKREKRIRIIRIAVAVAIAAACIVTLCMSFGRFLFAGREYKEECEILRSAEVGDEVYWGHFETNITRPGEERLVWTVVDKDGDKLCLLSKEGIAGGYYHQKHEGVRWTDSDLRERLNSEEFLKMFSKYEMGSIIPYEGDYISLLTAEQAGEFFASDKERELSITKAAEDKGTNTNRLSKHHQWDMKGYRSSWWWLKGTNETLEITAPIVTVDGLIEESEKTVNKPGGAIRPVIWVDPGGYEASGAE